jgi:glucose/arabinose dehydrogenase
VHLSEHGAVDVNDRAHRPSAAPATAVALLVVAAVGGCTGTEPGPTTAPSTPPVVSVSPSAEPAPDGSATTPADDATLPAPPELPAATEEPQDVATDLAAPWGIAFLPGGAALVTLRDAAEVVLIDRDGTTTLAGPGAEELAGSTRTDGEGGLLGIAVSPDAAQDRLVYLYRTTAEGNEVVRSVLGTDESGSLTLGRLEPVLTGIPAAGNHNGGRIAFGPDGHLYVATGDASVRDAAQDPDSLAGKILRVTADGDPAPGNPVAGSPVWSLGHRNVQGIGWDDEGRMYASEFGQSTFDELNRIEAGGNYGWPDVEGTGGLNGLTDPLLVWDPAEASPSGIAVTDGAVHMAALRGQRLWTVELEGGTVGEPRASLDLGRLRDVAVGPDGALWVLTNNTDGRGSPRPGDDRVVRLAAP